MQYDTISLYSHWSSNEEVTEEGGGGGEIPPPAVPDSEKPGSFEVKLQISGLHETCTCILSSVTSVIQPSFGLSIS